MRYPVFALGCLLLASCSNAAAEDSPKEAAKGKPPVTYVRVLTQEGKLSDPLIVPKVVRSDEEWRKRLTPEQYRIMRTAGTEAAFCGGLLKNKEAGIYLCVGCDLPLFESRREVRVRHRLAELLPAGRARRTSARSPTSATAWSAPRSTAPAAIRTSATCSTTARSRRGCASA